MRKFLAILIALLLAAASVAALADAAEVGTKVVYQAFDDFTLSVPEDDPVELAAKAQDELYFTIYSPATSGDNFSNNLTCIWNPSYEDLSAYDPQALLDETVSSFAGEAAGAGFTVSDMTALGADQLDLNGKDALALAYSYYADYTSLGVDLRMTVYCVQAFVSEPDFGTYIFTISAGNEAGVTELSDVLDSIAWK